MNYNRLLEVAPADFLERLRQCSEVVYLNRRQDLHVAGDLIQSVYFPFNCLLSITITTADGTTAETGLVGNRGVIGTNAFFSGRATTQSEYTVQIPGRALRVDAAFLRQEFEDNGALRYVILCYTQALIAQISQTTVCNSLHKVNQRLARWLLEAQEQTQSDELLLTQETLAQMLGVRRAGVSEAAQYLQAQGAIRYRRGCINIVGQQRLHGEACECFSRVKCEYDRLLGQPQQPLPDNLTR